MNVGDVKKKATWELRGIVKALSNGVSSMFNDENDIKVLKAAQTELKRRDSSTRTKKSVLA